jgi:hypothetical protein
VYATGVYAQLCKTGSEIRIFNLKHSVYEGGDVRIRVYFSKSKGVREKKRLGNAALRTSGVTLYCGLAVHTLRCGKCNLQQQYAVFISCVRKADVTSLYAH